MLIIPIVFIWVGHQTPGLRITSYSIVLGVLLILAGGLIINEYFLNTFRDHYSMMVLIYVLNDILK
jgi:hypothetical protein